MVRVTALVYPIASRQAAAGGFAVVAGSGLDCVIGAVGAPEEPLETKSASSVAPLTYQRRATRVRYVVLAFLCALSFLTYFDRVCIVRAQGEIQRDLRIDDVQMGVIMGAFWLAYAMFEIPSGLLGDRFGPRRTLTRIVIAWSVFTGLSGAAVGFASLLAWRFLFGAGEAGAYPNIARIQSRWLPPRTRARAGGLIWLLARWGGALSPVILGTMLRTAASPWFRRAFPWLGGVAPWRIGFFISAGVGFLWCALFFPWFRDDPAEKPAVNRAELDLITTGQDAGDGGGKHASMTGRWRALFTCPSLWGLGILYLCGSFGWSFFVSWMPRYFLKVHGVTYEKSEWISAGPLLCGGVACLVGGACCDWLVRATGRRRLARMVFPLLGCAMAAAAIYAIRFARTPGQATLLLCITAAAYDFGQAANWASIIDIGGNHAGTATGLINTVGNLGNFAQPVIGAFIFNHLGWNRLFLVLAGAYVMAGSMWLFVNPTRTFYERGESSLSAGGATESAG
jgi:MFS transporter, ACS family, glucarate transporter